MTEIARPTIEQRLEMADYLRQSEPGLLCDLGMCSDFNCGCRDTDDEYDDLLPCDSCGEDTSNPSGECTDCLTKGMYG
jgi:hypothetical protein